MDQDVDKLAGLRIGADDDCGQALQRRRGGGAHAGGAAPDQAS